jgi:hypothetical protein
MSSRRGSQERNRSVQGIFFNSSTRPNFTVCESTPIELSELPAAVGFSRDLDLVGGIRTAHWGYFRNTRHPSLSASLDHRFPAPTPDRLAVVGRPDEAGMSLLPMSFTVCESTPIDLSEPPGAVCMRRCLDPASELCPFHWGCCRTAGHACLCASSNRRSRLGHLARHTVVWRWARQG